MSARACAECATVEEMFYESLVDESAPWHGPATWFHCGRCDAHMERFRGQGDVACSECGTWHNASGQQLRDDWADNPAWVHDDVDDLTGFEIQHAGD